MQTQSRLSSFSPGDQETNRKPSTLLTRKSRHESTNRSFCISSLWQSSFLLHRLEVHASECDEIHRKMLTQSDQSPKCFSEPIPGLFLFEEFITEEEEREIMAQLDGRSAPHRHEFIPWSAKNSYGVHDGKRWGVHCNLKESKVSSAENPLPDFVKRIIIPKLTILPQMMGCIPNEANAIDYRRQKLHWLLAHVDNWHLSKEPIANISLAGDCIMTFCNVAPNRNAAISGKHVLLKRRTLQILTGNARYDFSHAIANRDLLSDRRVSITLRETPLTNNF